MTVKDVLLAPWISEHTIVMINHKRTASRTASQIDIIKGHYYDAKILDYSTYTVSSLYYRPDHDILDINV